MWRVSQCHDVTWCHDTFHNPWWWRDALTLTPLISILVRELQLFWQQSLVVDHIYRIQKQQQTMYCKKEWQTMMAMRTHYADIDHGRKEMDESNNYRILLLSTVYTSIGYSSSCIATCVTLHHRSSAQLSGRTMMAGTKIWNISNFMIKHSSITSCTTFVLVVKYFQAQRFYPNISDFWNSTPAAPDTSLLQRWSMMRVAGSAVKRSIGFTISFHNHGEDPY